MAQAARLRSSRETLRRFDERTIFLQSWGEHVGNVYGELAAIGASQTLSVTDGVQLRSFYSISDKRARQCAVLGADDDRQTRGRNEDSGPR